MLIYIIIFIVGVGVGVAMDFFYSKKISANKKIGDLNNDGIEWSNEDQAIWMKKRFTHNNPNKKTNKED